LTDGILRSLFLSSGKVWAILDTDNSMGHALAEMKFIRSLLSTGNYLVVEDSLLNRHPVDPRSFDLSPMTLKR